MSKVRNHRGGLSGDVLSHAINVVNVDASTDKSDGADKVNDSSQSPKTIPEAILTLLWPMRNKPIGIILLLLFVFIDSIYTVVSNDTLRAIFLVGYNDIKNTLTGRVSLVVVEPDNLWVLNMSVADFENVIQKRTGITDDVYVDSSDERNNKANAVLSCTIETAKEGIKLAVMVTSGKGTPIGEFSDIMPIELVPGAGKFFLDSMIRNLDVSWTTFAPQRSPHRDNPAAFALLLASQESTTSDTDAIALLDKALNLEPSFSTAHWVLGTKLMRVGKSDEAKQEFETARRIDPDVADFDYVDPTEALRRSLDRSHWEEIDKGISFLKLEQFPLMLHHSLWRRDSLRILAG